jgi:hypothetical protein
MKQSISEAMRQGNTQHRQRILALLKDCAPKTNHHFFPPLISQADADKSRVICRAAI